MFFNLALSTESSKSSLLFKEEISIKNLAWMWTQVSRPAVQPGWALEGAPVSQ